MIRIAAGGLIFSVLLGPAWAADDVPTIEGVLFVSCHDGDTCTFRLTGAARAMLGEIVKVRLANADAPEIGGRAECPEEAKLALAARDWIAGVLSRARMIRLKWMAPAVSRGNRYAAEIWAGQRNLGLLLVRKGLGRVPNGRKPHWCETPKARAK